MYSAALIIPILCFPFLQWLWSCHGRCGVMVKYGMYFASFYYYKIAKKRLRSQFLHVCFRNVNRMLSKTILPDIQYLNCSYNLSLPVVIQLDFSYNRHVINCLCKILCVKVFLGDFSTYHFYWPIYQLIMSWYGNIAVKIRL